MLFNVENWFCLTSLALIGLPGSGKTTAGKLLARQLGVPFVDTDHAIEQRLGCSIRAFFEAQGEEAFREVESEVLRELTDGPACVLSTGGGIVLRPQNRERLRSHCRVVYLRASPQALFQRLRNDRRRPLLQVADPLARLQALHDERAPLYEAVAHLTVDADHHKVHALAELIARLVGPDAAKG